MRNKGALYTGTIIIVLGLIMFFAQVTQGIGVLGTRLGWSAAWPFLILWVAFAFLLPLVIWPERRASLAGLVVPGTIVGVNGLILLFQNTTGLWRTWSYLWTLEPMAVALGLLALYWLTNRDRGLLVAAAIVGGVGLVFFFIFSGVLTFLGPLLLIALGVLVLVAGLGRRSRGAPGQMD